MIPGLPDPRPAIREIERTIEERREAMRRFKIPPGAEARVEAMEVALRWLRICEGMTYFEEN